MGEQERPYHDDSTASRLLSEVKHRRARLVLRWGTTLESRVLFFCHFTHPTTLLLFHSTNNQTFFSCPTFIPMTKFTTNVPLTRNSRGTQKPNQRGNSLHISHHSPPKTVFNLGCLCHHHLLQKASCTWTQLKLNHTTTLLVKRNQWLSIELFCHWHKSVKIAIGHHNH